eukprot:TRINITY_DN10112_c0_g5_i1.p1 TRINITY_DN10112_c0_g5~~TRINITY_DN10112_c0_g5_i1.p1  ORF type:complete len:306 (-),score=62.37 TRINITY_DN10112_c0_g5_i1:123-1016(-)
MNSTHKAKHHREKVPNSRLKLTTKRAKTTRMPAFKLFVDPSKAAKKQKQISKQFFISTKKITVSPPSTQAEVSPLLTDRKSAAGSAARFGLSSRPYREKIDKITDEIVEIVRKKLSGIREEQKEELSIKDSLGVLLTNSKDELQNTLKDLESRREMLKRIRCVNEKLKADCRALRGDVDTLKNKISDLHKVHRDNIETVQESAAAACERKQELARDIQGLVEVRNQDEAQFLKEKAVYEELIDEKAKEVLELRSKLRELGVKENYRVGRFVSDTHSIEVSINGIRSMKRAKSIHLKS